jgi:hypothetical protein
MDAHYLAVPAASSMEAAAYAVAEASDMGDTHAVGETATPKMGDILPAVGETAASEMGGTYAAAETHAVMGDGPLGAFAHMAEAVWIEFTRCRPYRKNDQAGVEQKNGAVVRRTIRYRRFRRRSCRGRLFFRRALRADGRDREAAKVRQSCLDAQHRRGFNSHRYPRVAGHRPRPGLCRES